MTPIRILLLAAASSASLLAACETKPAAPPPSSNPPASEPAPKLRLPEDVKPTAYELMLDVDPTQARFSGHEMISVQLDKPRATIWLHGRGLHVTAATAKSASGVPLTAVYKELGNDDGFASLTLPSPLPAGAATIDISWDAAYNPQLVGVYKAAEAGVDYVFSQFEATDARAAFPCFDEPMFKTPFTVTLTVPEADVAVSNASQTEETKVDGGKKRVKFATTKPLPTYLVALAVGPFDVVEHAPLPPSDVRKRPLPFRGLAPKGRGPELQVALDAAAGLLVEEERYFGIEYPYDKLDHIAVPDFAYGAMENAGAITYREEDLLYVEGKSPFTQRRGIYNTMAHEMAHQWFGDLVTLRWWTDAWLNESFATWMAARTVDAWSPKEHERIEVQRSSNWVMRKDALATARAIRQPVERTADIWNQFDGLTYQKGAAVLGMLESWIGEDKFRAGVSNYLKAHAFGGGSTDDLLKSYSDAAGRDVAPAFKSFIEQAGVPLVEAITTCDNGKALLALKQSRFVPIGSKADTERRWQIPVCARYGTGAAAHDSCTLLTDSVGELALDGGCPTWLTPNARGAGYYRWSLPPKELTALAKAWPQLLPRERLSYVYNVRAGVESGALTAADGLRALAPAARDGDALVAIEPLLLLRNVYETLVTPALRPRVAAYAIGLYRPVLTRLGWTPKKGESSETRELRSQIIAALTDMGDAQTRKEALAKAHALFDEATGTFKLDAVDGDLRTITLAVLVQEDGAKAFDALVKALDASNDAVLRRQIVAALADTHDAALFARAEELIAGPHVHNGDRVTALFALTMPIEGRERLLAWLPAHLDDILKAVPVTQATNLPWLFASLYAPAQVSAVKALFEPRFQAVPGIEREQKQSLEQMQLVDAYVVKQRPSADAFFSGERNP